MKKTISFIILAILIILAANFLYGREGDTPAVSAPNDAVNAYFRDQMINRAIADIGMAIEGFDPNLLMKAYPGLIAADFQGVEAYEGKYEVRAGVPEFVRDREEPITSAERTVADKGYATLLANVSKRLGMSATTEAEADAVIAKVDTGEHAELRIGESKVVLGETIAVKALVEDSRCPPTANCVRAGTVKVRADVTGGMGTADMVFELGKEYTTEVNAITLVSVSPEKFASEAAKPSEYVFVFKVERR